MGPCPCGHGSPCRAAGCRACMCFNGAVSLRTRKCAIDGPDAQRELASMGPCPCGHGSGVRTNHVFAAPHRVKQTFDVHCPSLSISLHRLQAPHEYIMRRECPRRQTSARKRSHIVFFILLIPIGHLPRSHHTISSAHAAGIMSLSPQLAPRASSLLPVAQAPSRRLQRARAAAGTCQTLVSLCT